MVAGMGFEPHDLRVMSPMSYLAALPRDIKHRFPPMLIYNTTLKFICQVFCHF